MEQKISVKLDDKIVACIDEIALTFELDREQVISIAIGSLLDVIEKNVEDVKKNN